MPLFFNPTATTEIYTLSLHDALPISVHARAEEPPALLLESDDALTLHGRMIQRFGPLETQAVEQRLEQTRPRDVGRAVEVAREPHLEAPRARERAQHAARRRELGFGALRHGHLRRPRHAWAALRGER